MILFPSSALLCPPFRSSFVQLLAAVAFSSFSSFYATVLPAPLHTLTALRCCSVKATEVAGRLEGSCPNQQFVQTSYKDIFANVFSSTYLSTNFRCPSSYYRSGPECLSCPDMSSSDAGSSKVEDCRGFLTMVFSMKDASVTFNGRTRSLEFGGMQDAQPYALSLMNYTGLAQSAPLFIKTRGYALHPYQYINPSFPSLGLQTIRCQEGSNCFNASQVSASSSSSSSSSFSSSSASLFLPFILPSSFCYSDYLELPYPTFLLFLFWCA